MDDQLENKRNLKQLIMDILKLKLEVQKSEKQLDEMYSFDQFNVANPIY